MIPPEFPLDCTDRSRAGRTRPRMPIEARNVSNRRSGARDTGPLSVCRPLVVVVRHSLLPARGKMARLPAGLRGFSGCLRRQADQSEWSFKKGATGEPPGRRILGRRPAQRLARGPGVPCEIGDTEAALADPSFTDYQMNSFVRVSVRFAPPPTSIEEPGDRFGEILSLDGHIAQEKQQPRPRRPPARGESRICSC
jgi:hypothetical protein